MGRTPFCVLSTSPFAFCYICVFRRLLSNSRLYPSQSLLCFSLNISVNVCILASVQSAKFSASASASAGFSGSRIPARMVRHDAVLQLACQTRRKIRDTADGVIHHLHPDNDMPKQLPVIRIIIIRECRQFLCLSDIMADRRRI